MDSTDQAGIRLDDAAGGDSCDGVAVPQLKPVLAVEPSRGQAMITRFECRTLLNMLVILLLHTRVKRDVRRLARGYLGIVLLRDWRHRTILSISLWQDLMSVYSMGEVPRHVAAARVPGKLRIGTSCGVFCYAGDWRQVMFGGGPAESPLSPWRPTRPAPPGLARPPVVTHVEPGRSEFSNPGTT